MIRIIAISHARLQPWKALQEEYMKRLKLYARVECVLMPPDRSSDVVQRVRREGDALIGKLRPHETAVLLDADGSEYTTEEFARRAQRWLEKGNTAFLIGGAYGVSEDLKRNVPERLSLSRMTMPHDLARVFLLEQLYRAISIARGTPYHH